MTLRGRLAWWSLWLIRWRPVKGVDYTSRCPGCGYFDGEAELCADHYGWDCRFVAYPWWSHLAEWWWSTGLIGWLTRWRHRRDKVPF